MLTNVTLWSDLRMFAARRCLSLTMRLAPRNHPGMLSLGCFWMDATMADKAAEARLEQAADRLFTLGKDYGWFQTDAVDWRETAPVARDEFLRMADQIVKAYNG